MRKTTSKQRIRLIAAPPRNLVARALSARGNAGGGKHARPRSERGTTRYLDRGGRFFDLA